MSKPYSILRGKMKPAARKKAAEKTKALFDAMPLQELRHARNQSQEQPAQALSVKQAVVSKLGKQTESSYIVVSFFSVASCFDV